MEQKIITLTTDWGYHDFFAGMVKGKLYSYIPDAQVVDITHGLKPYTLNRAVFVVKNACLGFPEGTIHIIDIGSSQTKDNPFIVVEHAGQYFICTDNGLPYAIFGDTDYWAVIIDNIMQEGSFYTFAACDLFCKVASLLAHGAQLEELGIPVESLTRLDSFGTVVYDQSIKVYIEHIDDYGNFYLNITYSEFESLRAGRPFVMQVGGVKITQIVRGYNDYGNPENNKKNMSNPLLLTVSSTGHLELFIANGDAEQMMNLHLFDEITILFN